MLDFRQKAELCAGVLYDSRAEDIVLLDLRGISQVTDMFVIASGDNKRMLKAAANRVLAELKEHGEIPLGHEGIAAGEWVLLDFNDVIVHIFQERMREFYDLEFLWGSATRIPWSPPHKTASEADE